MGGVARLALLNVICLPCPYGLHTLARWPARVALHYKLDMPIKYFVLIVFRDPGKRRSFLLAGVVEPDQLEEVGLFLLIEDREENVWVQVIHWGASCYSII